MNTPHLLSLATLHTAAPGVLDVVFGPDGDFTGAPEWRCPIWDAEDGPDGDWMGISRHALHPIADQFDPLDTMLLDFRIPSVAARLAALCARALDFWHVGPFDGAWGVYLGSIDDGPWGWTIGCAGWSSDYIPNDLVPNADTIHTEAEFIAALTVALAPRIAALKVAP